MQTSPISHVVVRDRIARRMLLLFLLTAVTPVIVAGALGHGQVTDLLHRQASERLARIARDFGDGLFERLSFLTSEARLFAESDNLDHLLSWPDVVGRIDVTGSYELERGRGRPPALGDRERRRVAAGRSALTSDRSNGTIWLHVPVHSTVVVLGFAADSLTEKFAELPFGVDLCVLDDAYRPLYCSDDTSLPSSPRAFLDASGDFVAMDATRSNRLYAYWQLFMTDAFGREAWYILGSEREATALAPLRRLRKLALPVALLTLVLVALTSMIQLRRRLGPVEQLMDGTRRLAEEDFSSRVEVSSDDEFGELARSFNHMARRIERQFRTLQELSEIDEMILVTSGVERTLEELVSRVRGLVMCEAVSVVLIDPDATMRGMLYYAGASGSSGIEVQRVSLSPAELETLQIMPQGNWIDMPEGAPDYLRPMLSGPGRSVFVHPVVREKRIAAVVGLAFADESGTHDQDVRQIRAFGHRLSVALAYVEREKELLRRANYDLLTGLPNRQLFQDRLQQELQRAEAAEHTVAVLFIDLDEFKTVNDTIGHSAGDLLLRLAAERLKAFARNVDTVARLGGDEFTLLVAGSCQPHQAAELAERVVHRFSEPFSLEGREYRVTASVGIAIYPDDGDDTETLLKNADTAMYAAKAGGRNGAQFFEERMTEEALRRIDLETELRRALKASEFTVYYQPILELRGQRIVAAEALVRWRHPEQGLISPAEFIPVAEDSGLIGPLDQVVLEAVCSKLSEWGGDRQLVERVSVNVSARNFADCGFASRVRDTLSRYEVAPGFLTIEVTEGSIVRDPARAVALLEELRAIGVKIALDDFGTGYSSLSYLATLPIDILKIDRTFVAGIMDSQHARALVRAVIQMAHAMQMTVVAEGIEEADQAAQLADMGCDLIQGYWVAKPAGAEEFERAVREHAWQRKPTGGSESGSLRAS